LHAASLLAPGPSDIHKQAQNLAKRTAALLQSQQVARAA
jgi:hypothetical protein